jgi:hypothetical protein
MPKVWYKDHAFKPAALEIIATADAICNEYMAQGFTLTLRQLYYQFVARGLIANKQSEYDRLGSIINDARLAGLIDWDALEDRTRNLESLSHWNHPSEILTAVSQQFRYDLWANQDTRLEVWIEKEALAGVIEPICNKWRIPYFACRGYVSQSESWRAGERFLDYMRQGQQVTVLHLGDHDPSGIDMTRDNKDRIDGFIREALSEELGALPVEYFSIERLALNMDQVRKYKPPPNPAKFTDSRATGYVSKFGTSSWELDALEPRVIADLIETNILSALDEEKWDEAKARETKARERLATLGKTWKDEE